MTQNTHNYNLSKYEGQLAKEQKTSLDHAMMKLRYTPEEIGRFFHETQGISVQDKVACVELSAEKKVELSTLKEFINQSYEVNSIVDLVYLKEECCPGRENGLENSITYDNILFLANLTAKKIGKKKQPQITEMRNMIDTIETTLYDNTEYDVTISDVLFEMEKIYNNKEYNGLSFDLALSMAINVISKDIYADPDYEKARHKVIHDEWI